MNKIILLLTVALLAIACTQQKNNKTTETDFTQYVNPFIGTAFTGHTFPGATYPLGMMQPGPQTGNYSWAYCAGYFYEDSLIQGFTQNRLNGTGCVDLGDLLVQPFSGERRDNLDSRFDKATEKASPGYYTVHLADNNVGVEITTSPRVAFHKYTFGKDEAANMLVDFQSGLVWQDVRYHTHVLDNEVNFENEYTISGFTRRTEWVERVYFFVIEFDKPIIRKEELPQQNPRENASRYIFTFDMQDDEVLQMKIAMSSASVEGAKANMAAEVNGWDFNSVYQNTQKAWNNYLSRVQIEGSEDDKFNFYTSMYHLYIQPNNIADVDGKYIDDSS
ncbi:MAG: glycoside hydrolase family 92 protein, partial [Bacteroidia bacterium]|nr:glycoside hydrolase family 92 protein [Bacteroidia bacterium]